MILLDTSGHFPSHFAWRVSQKGQKSNLKCLCLAHSITFIHDVFTTFPVSRLGRGHGFKKKVLAPKKTPLKFNSLRAIFQRPEFPTKSSREVQRFCRFASNNQDLSIFTWQFPRLDMSFSELWAQTQHIKSAPYGWPDQKNGPIFQGSVLAYRYPPPSSIPSSKLLPAVGAWAHLPQFSG